jgi:hypothetical protein
MSSGVACRNMLRMVCRFNLPAAGGLRVGDFQAAIRSQTPSLAFNVTWIFWFLFDPNQAIIRNAA